MALLTLFLARAFPAAPFASHYCEDALIMIADRSSVYRRAFTSARGGHFLRRGEFGGTSASTRVTAGAWSIHPNVSAARFACSVNDGLS
jgi:hypothetical protein